MMNVATLRKNDDAPLEAAPVSILIVDDLEEKHVVYRTILEELGQNLVFAHSGEEALKQLLQMEFAVILLDVNMPGMDGFETANLIRMRKKSARTPIIFLTAFTDEMHVAQGYASGAVDYLPTPVIPEVLKAKVRVFIELSQTRQQAAFQAHERALRTAAEESARRSEFLVEAGLALARSSGIDQALSTIAEFPVKGFADAAVVWLQDDYTPQGHMKWRGPGMEKAEDASALFARMPWLEKACRRVQDSGQLLPVREFSGDGGPLRPADAICQPISLQGRTRGVLIAMRCEDSPSFTQADILLSGDFAGRASAALENVVLIERIQEADRRKDEFLATLAHELRNPLAPISNALQIMRLINPSDARLVQIGDVMQRQVEHMNRLVDDLLDVSRITQGRIELKKETIELARVINSAVETSRPLIDQSRHRLVVALPDEAVFLHGDMTRLSQIFSNLLNNSAKYTPLGGQINLSSRIEGGELVTTVQDNGSGIPQHMQPRIFDMFTQVDSSIERSQGGLGIGLKLVKELCELHGGSVSVSSEGLGKGSAFTVRLPIAESPGAVASAAAQDLPEGSFRVLVVDDNDASAKTMVWTMELLGHSCQLAHDGPTAIRMASEFKPHVVLLDIGLPGMNGYDVCRKMREDQAFSDTIFIAQTGWGQPEHRQRSREAGFHHHLIKPVNMDTLRQLMHQLKPVNAPETIKKTS